MTDWLVLGAGGQLGRCLQEALTESGTPHVALTSPECDITDPSALEHSLGRHKPRVVVNCAAWTAVDAAEDNVETAFSVNCRGAGNVARACRAAGSLLVHVSTDYVFPGTESGPYAEDAPTGPVSAYGKSKLCGELEVLAALPDASYIVRTAWLYSRHGGNFAKTMLRRALTGTPVRVVDDQRGQPTLADDLARHIIDIVSAHAPFGVYHGTNSGEASWCDFARDIFRLSGSGEHLVSAVDSSEYPTRAVRPRNSVLGHDRTRLNGLTEMRHWSAALAASVRAIIDVIDEEAGK